MSVLGGQLVNAREQCDLAVNVFSHANFIRKCKALIFFVFIQSLILERVFADDMNLGFIEKETSMSGWSREGECIVNSRNLSLEYYSPPRRRDIGGYGILKSGPNPKKTIAYGHDLYPVNKQGDCGIVVMDDVIIVNSSDWSKAKKYVVAIDLLDKSKRSFQYNLKKTTVYERRLSDTIYIVAGFGVCEKSKRENWVSDLYCEDVGKDRLDLARNYLKAETGFDLVPYIPGVGAGVFRYYILCDKCSYLDEKIRSSLRDYVEKVLDKLESKKRELSKNELYGSLLAIASVRLIEQDLEKYVLQEKLLEKYYEDGNMDLTFSNYWKAIFNAN